jgi:DNA-binding CsgD family transcriptional regulator/tetratricopeptide (TPR) repeat protein
MSLIRFVARQAELSLLAGLVEALCAGVGGVVIVDGEQGIGKTALLRAGLGGADNLGCQVLWASADKAGRLFPLRLILECADSLARAAMAEPSLPRPAFGTDPVLAETERLLAAVDELCATAPVLLVLEDLQWADDASLLVWDRLSHAAGQMPLLLAGSWRQGSGRADLGKLRRAVVAGGGDALRLGPLRPRDVAAMVADIVGGLPGRRLTELMARAGGNPLYVTELAEGLLRERQVRVDGGVAEVTVAQAPRIPTALSAAIKDRLSGLAEPEVAVLRWAAVLGPEFSLKDLAAVSGRPSADLMAVLESATAAGVVTRADGGRTGFRHGLIRQVLYDGMPASLRATLHARAAQALANSGAPAEQVAGQLVPVRDEPDATPAGPLPEWVADWLVGSAGALMRRAPQAAAALVGAALAEQADGSRREALEAALVTASFLLARHKQVEQLGRPLMTRSADADRAAEMGWLVAYTLMRTGRLPEAGGVVAEISARPEISAGHRARLTALQAMIRFSLGRTEEAIASGDLALAQARRAGDAIAAGYALQALSAIRFGQREQVVALHLAEQALAAIGDDPRATDLRALLLTNKASALREMDQPGAAMAAGHQALVLAEQAGTHRIGAARFAVAELHYLNGQWDDALAELEVAARSAGQDYLPAMVHGLAALIAGQRDHRESMAAHLDVVASFLVSPGAVDHTSFLMAARAVAAEQAGNLGLAAGLLAACLEPGIAERMSTRCKLLPALARLAFVTGNAELAAATEQAARAEAAAEPIAVKVATASHCQGLAADDPGPVAQAVDYFLSAGRPHDQALALEDLAALRAGHGELTAARTALGKALVLYHGLGARWDARRATTRLSAAGVRAPSIRYQTRPATGWDALTPTELRVAHLVAKGLSNRDIAAELFLSRNTAQTHVSHILAKLRGRSRADIMREALRATWQPMTTDADGPG